MSLTDLQWEFEGDSLPDGARSSSGYAHSSDWGMVSSGGQNGDGEFLGTVLQTRDGSNFDFLPDLPEVAHSHCLTVIDETRLFAAGGRLDRVYIFDANDSAWSDVGALPSGSSLYLVCGVVRDTNDGRALKVVVAGAGSDLDAVDIYNLETMQWQDGGRYEVYNLQFSSICIM